jgi:asparagine synthase (glutamine-hydrolysing)
MARRWAQSPHRVDRPVERPGIVWSGDGGSVGFGCVGVYPSVIGLLRAGKRNAAVQKYFAEHEISLPLRAFKRSIAREIRDLLNQGVREALDEVRDESEPGRELYFFRMLHDQRRHMALHFEDMDLHGLEFHLPFYDAEVIEVIASAPADYCPRHRLYHRALPYFPPVVQAVPWQTYPGHETCPVTLGDTGLSQWGEDQRELLRRRRQRTIVHEAARAIWSPTFPGPLLNRWYLLAGSVLHWLGRGDYSYVLEYADRLDGLWRVSHGRWSFE